MIANSYSREGKVFLGGEERREEMPLDPGRELRTLGKGLFSHTLCASLHVHRHASCHAVKPFYSHEIDSEACKRLAPKVGRLRRRVSRRGGLSLPLAIHRLSCQKQRMMGLMARRRSSVPTELDLDVQLDFKDSGAGDSFALSPTTPIYATFASTPAPVPPLPKPVLVASIPRASRAVDGTAATSSPAAAPPPMTVDAAHGGTSSVPFPSESSSSSPIRSVAPSPTPPRHPESPLEDGPLARAIVANNERRCKALRTSLKGFIRTASDSVSTLQANAAAQAAVDESLSALSSSASTSASKVLSGLYSSSLRGRREELRESSRREIEELKGLLDRVKDAVERLKTVDARKRTFEAESKKHYDELSKVSHIAVHTATSAPADDHPFPLVSRPNGARFAQGRIPRLEASSQDSNVRAATTRVSPLRRRTDRGRGSCRCDLVTPMGGSCRRPFGAHHRLGGSSAREQE